MEKAFFEQGESISLSNSPKPGYRFIRYEIADKSTGTSVDAEYVPVDGNSITTNLSAVMACFNNIGPGLDMVGPTGNYAAFSPLSKLVLSVDMLAGRLEIFPILVLLSHGTWRKR